MTERFADTDRFAETVKASTACGWLRRFAPDGRCKTCGEPLPRDRRFTHEACDQAVEAERRAAPPAASGPAGPGHVLDALTYRPLLSGAVAIDDPGYPAEDCWSRASQRLLRGWQPSAGGVWVRGTVGSGKSTGLVGLYLRLRREGVPAVLTSWRHLAGVLQGLRREGRWHEALEGLAEVDVLLVDDLLVEVPTEAERGALYELLDGRLGARRPVVATSNRELNSTTAALAGGGREEDQAQAQRITGRLRALVREEVSCVFPGDRRVGTWDEGLAAEWAGMLEPGRCRWCPPKGSCAGRQP